MTHQITLAWLKVAGLSIVAVSMYFSWATTGNLAVANEAFVDLIFWPVDGAQSYAAAETRALSAIGGGVAVGLGLAIFTVAREVFATDPARGRRIILTIMLGWFVVDSIGSVIAGAWFNVVINVVILAFVCWPLAGRAKAAHVA